MSPGQIDSTLQKSFKCELQPGQRSTNCWQD